jgi:peptidoglycan/xylan/chitin deacetylase (PgdA/CDA1 family)
LNELRILCYHNFSSGDFIKWTPHLHITPETFRKRVKYITGGGYSILRLGEAVELLNDNKKLPNMSTVITIDDGWANILKSAHPILKLANVPYTVYVTSWYSINNKPIFNLAVQYVLWKAKSNGLDLCKLTLPIEFNFKDLEEGGSLSKKIIDYGIKKLSLSERYSLLQDLCRQTGIDYCKLEFDRELTLLDEHDLEKLCADGVDLQLHTHTHSWPLDEKLANFQLSENRVFLEKITKQSVCHFCYPSGIWDFSQIDYLQKNMIKSATTCERGLNNNQTNIYALNRYLDSEAIPQIVFEAEMSGFIHLLEKYGLLKLKGLLRNFVHKGVACRLPMHY